MCKSLIILSYIMSLSISEQDRGPAIEAIAMQDNEVWDTRPSLTPASSLSSSLLCGARLENETLFARKIDQETT